MKEIRWIEKSRVAQSKFEFLIRSEGGVLAALVVLLGQRALRDAEDTRRGASEDSQKTLEESQGRGSWLPG